MAPGTDDTRPLVLVVEDDQYLAEFLEYVLADHGYRPLVCHLGRAALAAARRLQPAAIVLDLLLPDLDGWDVLRHLGTDARTGRIPVLVASADPGRLVKRERDLAVAVMSKPLVVAELLAALDGAIRPPAAHAG